jgi:hypothetical protein
MIAGFAIPASNDTALLQGMFPQRLNRVPDGIPETEGNLRKILVNEVVTKLENNVVARCLPVEKLHDREPDLRWASKPSIRWLTVFQKSASANSFDASPS